MNVTQQKTGLLHHISFPIRDDPPLSGAQYQYQGLEREREIRLLALLPKDHEDDPLQGQLFHVLLPEAETYDALSYAWGAPEKSFSLLTPEGEIPITASLHSALRRLRQPATYYRLLWIDAICIDQDNNTEKPSQIRLMAQIYGQASQVLIDLGEEDETSRLAIRTFDIFDHWELYQVPEPGRDATNPETLKKSGLPPRDDKSWEAIAAFLRRPWFRRVWVIQELVVASQATVICGNYSTDWETFFWYIHVINIYYNTLVPPGPFDAASDDHVITYDSMDAIGQLGNHKLSFQSGHRIPLLTWITEFRASQATLARDHLFAFLGLDEDANDPLLDPDYNEPFQSVVRRFAAHFVQRGRISHLLYWAACNSESEKFPSWVPDWTARENPWKTNFGTSRLSEQGIFAAGGTAAAVATYDLPLDTLHICGVYADRVDYVGPDFYSGDLEKVPDLVRQYAYYKNMTDILGSQSSYPTGESSWDIAWKTMIAGQLSGIDTENAIEATEELFSAWLDLATRMVEDILNETVELSLNDDEEKARAILAFYKRLEYMTRIVKLCRTEQGYVGTVPKDTRVGDVVAVLQGVNVPFIIKRSNTRPGIFQLVGNCYMHGMMKGELFAKADSGCEVIPLH